MGRPLRGGPYFIDFDASTGKGGGLRAGNAAKDHKVSHSVAAETVAAVDAAGNLTAGEWDRGRFPVPRIFSVGKMSFFT